jgi:hypothetical protein
MNKSAKIMSKEIALQSCHFVNGRGNEETWRYQNGGGETKPYWDLLGQVLTAKFTKFLVIMIMKLKFHLKFSEIVGVRDE